MAIATRDKRRIAEINGHIQHKLVEEGLDEVAAVRAAEWLGVSGLLGDRQDRRGAPLRNLLRAGLIDGSDARTYGKTVRWFIRRVR